MRVLNQIENIVIVGGGSAGWMSAALLSKLTQGKFTIHLVESDEISTIGVGEATIPAIKIYNHLLGLNETEFVQATQATFKLGIEFCNWGKKGDKYFHAFGALGRSWEWLSFYQYWMKLHRLGKASAFEHYCITSQMSLHNRFTPPDPTRKNSPLNEIAYAYHFDASLYARYLRTLSENNGVLRSEGKITQVKQNIDSGHIESVVLENGTEIKGDLFIDCSGMHALLIEKTLKTGFEDWSHWLPCNRAWALPSEALPTLHPYTQASAHDAGWQWRIPLQHRTGNGLVFSNDFMDEERALTLLQCKLNTTPVADPRLIKFKAGKRKKMWNANCIAIGLSSGFIEPLESTSLHLVQTAITRLISLFPDKNFAQVNIDHFNRQTDFEIERIRDFVIAHYKVTEREDTPFWRYCKHMKVPPALQEKLAVFKAYGRIERVADELFREDSWVQVLIGQRLMPKYYDPLVDVKSEAEIEEFLNITKSVIAKCVEGMPYHAQFILNNFSPKAGLKSVKN